MKQSLILAIFVVTVLLPITTAYGQDSTNIQLLNNVFDVYRPGGDSLNIVSPVLTEIADTSTFSVNGAENSSINEDPNNPFEVSHVPIRRNQIVDRSQTTVEESPVDFFRRHLALWAMLLMIVLIALVLGRNRDFIAKTFRALLNENQLQIYSREESNGFSVPGLLLMSNYILALGLFTYHLAYPNSANSFPMYGLFVFIVLALYMAKYAQLALIRSVFPNLAKPLQYYIAISVVCLSLFGLVLIVIDFFLYYGPAISIKPIHWLGVILFGLLLLLRYSKTIVNHLYTISSNVFFFLLYLCATEIAPVTILYKVVVDYLNT